MAFLLRPYGVHTVHLILVLRRARAANKSDPIWWTQCVLSDSECVRNNYYYYYYCCCCYENHGPPARVVRYKAAAFCGDRTSIGMIYAKDINPISSREKLSDEIVKNYIIEIMKIWTLLLIVYAVYWCLSIVTSPHLAAIGASVNKAIWKYQKFVRRNRSWHYQHYGQVKVNRRKTNLTNRVQECNLSLLFFCAWNINPETKYD